VPYEVYLDSEKRPQVSVHADRVERAQGFVNFYLGDEVVASFKEEKVVGYVRLAGPETL
jgi:hypothetical protein